MLPGINYQNISGTNGFLDGINEAKVVLNYLSTSFDLLQESFER